MPTQLLLLFCMVALTIGSPAAPPGWSQRLIEKLRLPEGEPAVQRVHALPQPDAWAALETALPPLLPAGSSVRLLPVGDRFELTAPPATQAAIETLLNDWKARETRRDAEARDQLLSLVRSPPPPPDPGALAAELAALLQEQPDRGISPATVAITSACLILVVAGSAFAFRRRSPSPAVQLIPAAQPLGAGAAASSQPEELRLAVADFGERLQAALEVRRSELSDLKVELAALRGAGDAERVQLEAAAASVQETALRLTRENDRVAALSDELRNTLGALDSARERLHEAETVLHQRDVELAERRSDLERERAKLVALSLLLRQGEPDRAEPDPATSPGLARESTAATLQLAQPLPEPPPGGWQFLPPEEAAA